MYKTWWDVEFGGSDSGNRFIGSLFRMRVVCKLDYYL